MRIETRSLPGSLAAARRGFAFCLADPIGSAADCGKNDDRNNWQSVIGDWQFFSFLFVPFQDDAMHDSVDYFVILNEVKDLAQAD